MTVPDEFFSTPAMTAVFSPEAHVRAMLTFEAALARAETRAGIIPPGAAQAIGDACRVEVFDVAALYREAALAGTLAIPLVRMLTERVEGNTKRYVHWGATSQDTVDTALVLQMREGLDLLIDDLMMVAAICADLAERHRRTPMAGRTLLQQALPITFGLKSARWLSLVTRQVRRLREVRERAGGSIPIIRRLRALGAPVLLTGIGLPDDGLHSPNEKLDLKQLWEGINVFGRFMERFAATAR